MEKSEKICHAYDEYNILHCHALHSKSIFIQIESSPHYHFSITDAHILLINIVVEFSPCEKPKWTCNQLIDLPRNCHHAECNEHLNLAAQLQCNNVTSFTLHHRSTCSHSLTLCLSSFFLCFSRVFCIIFFAFSFFGKTLIIKLELCRFLFSFFEFSFDALTFVDYKSKLLFFRAVLTRTFEKKRRDGKREKTRIQTIMNMQHHLCVCVFIDDDNEYHNSLRVIIMQRACVCARMCSQIVSITYSINLTALVNSFWRNVNLFKGYVQ